MQDAVKNMADVLKACAAHYSMNVEIRLHIAIDNWDANGNMANAIRHNAPYKCYLFVFNKCPLM